MIELQRILAVSGVFSVLFLFSESIYAKLQLKSEYSRKLVHICTGCIGMTFPFVFHSFWEVAVLCSMFIVVLSIVEYKAMLPSITNIDRESSGSIYFPISVMMVFAYYCIDGSLSSYIYPLIILTFCDPLAALVGKKFGVRKINFLKSEKTYMGSITFFISAIIVTILTSMVLDHGASIYTILIISTVTTIAEAVSVKGSDNLSIPLVTIGSLIFLSV